MTRQISVAESWKRTYEAFQDINFSGFDFFTVKSSLIDYLRLHYAETFNDYIESSEQIAIIEVFAYIAELLAYRIDMNAHENLISYAQRKQNVLQLAKLVSYSASRNIPLRGLVKITQVTTSETVYDSSGINLANKLIVWNDPNNINWKEQFTLVVNTILQQPFGTVLPNDRVQVDDVVFEVYSLKNNSLSNNVIPFTASINGKSLNFEMVPSLLNEYGPYEKRPTRNGRFSILYASDGVGDSSDNTGFFVYFKQGNLQRTTRTYDGITPNQTTTLNVDNINETDVWVNQIDPETGDIIRDRTVDLLGRTLGYQGEWIAVNNTTTNNVLYNNMPNRNKYEIETLEDDNIKIIYGDGEYAEIPNGTFDIWYRTSENETLVLPKSQIVNKKASLGYTDNIGTTQTFTFSYSLVNSVANNSSSEDIESIRKIAPAVYFTQDRMVTDRDYNTYMLQDPTILKLRAVNRTFAGDSKYIEWHDPSGTYENVQIMGRDLRLFFNDGKTLIDVPVNSTNESVIKNYMQPKLSLSAVKAFHTRNDIPSTRVVFTEQEVVDLISKITNINPADVPLKVAFINNDTKGYQSLSFNSAALQGADLNNGINGDGDEDFLINLSVNGVDKSIGIILNPNIKTITLEYIVEAFNNAFNSADPVIDAVAFLQGSVIYIQSTISGNESRIVLNADDVAALTDKLNYFSHLSEDVRGTSVSIWRGYSSKVPLLTAHTFEIIPTGYVAPNRYVYWDVKYFSSQLTCESDSTTFWNTNKSLYVVNGNTLTPVQDKVVILSANINKNKNDVLTQDINLNVVGLDVQTENENLGMYYLNRLLLETEDVNNDFEPDDVLLTNTLFNKVVTGNDIDIQADENDTDYDMIVLPQTHISGYGEIDVFYDGVKLIRGADYYDINDSVNRQAVIAGAYSSAVKIKKTSYSDSTLLSVVYYDYVYYQEDTNAVYKFVESTKNIKDMWYAQTEPRVVRYSGRTNLNFMWIYTTPYFNLVNPAPTNIHDMFIITRGYYQQLQLWLTGTSLQPTPPSPYELRNTYGTYLQNKMRSDHVVLHPGKIKLIIGKKSIPQLQAKIKVVKDPYSKLTDNEIKARIVSIVREFFDINYWEFGESFSFSELSAVIHGRLTSDVKSVVLVPTLSTHQFGDLYEINASDEEIIQPDITTDDIEMVASLNVNTLKQNPS